MNNNDYGSVEDVVAPYVDWVQNVQSQSDPNGIDVRVEPKFEIPSGAPYTGGWCRPQTDGPGLRAMALAQWGEILLDNGMDTSQVWGLIQNDLDWVVNNWYTSGCDLWEEVTSDDFYFNRMAYVYSLNKVADFADALGDSAAASSYRGVAGEVQSTISVRHGS